MLLSVYIKEKSNIYVLFLILFLLSSSTKSINILSICVEIARVLLVGILFLLLNIHNAVNWNVVEKFNVLGNFNLGSEKCSLWVDASISYPYDIVISYHYEMGSRSYNIIMI